VQNIIQAAADLQLTAVHPHVTLLKIANWCNLPVLTEDVHGVHGILPGKAFQG